MTYSDWLRTRACEGKRPYQDKREALQGARDSAVTYQEPYEAWQTYRCQHCNSWHVGHRPGWKPEVTS